MLTRIVLSVIAAVTISGVTMPSFCGRQVRDLEALALEALAGVEHALVLGLDGDDVVALLLVEAGRALDREVVRLGRARGQDDLLAVAADQRRDLLRACSTAASAVQPNTWLRLAALPKCCVKNGSIASRTRGSTARRRVVVHEDRELHAHGDGDVDLGLAWRRTSVVSFAIQHGDRHVERPSRPARQRGATAPRTAAAHRPCDGRGDRTRRTRSARSRRSSVWQESRYASASLRSFSITWSCVICSRICACFSMNSARTRSVASRPEPAPWKSFTKPWISASVKPIAWSFTIQWMRSTASGP